MTEEFNKSSGFKIGLEQRRDPFTNRESSGTPAPGDYKNTETAFALTKSAS